MSVIREELSQLLDTVPDEDLPQVRDFVKVLLREPEDLTEKEWAEVDEGEEEFRRGEWVKWKDVRRTDV